MNKEAQKLSKLRWSKPKAKEERIEYLKSFWTEKRKKEHSKKMKKKWKERKEKLCTN